METIHKIRRRRLVNDESISAISRSLKLSRNTVKKYLNTTDEPLYQRQYQVKPKLEPFQTILETWLEKDYSLPKSRRRTARRIFEGIQAEGYQGAYDSIQRFVKAWKANRSTTIRPTQAFIPLTFKPGEVCQFDWSQEHVVLSGMPQTIKVAHFRLAYSRQCFVIAYPRETQEMVLDAHVKAFAFFGGVPKQVVYDNLKTVVDKIFKGKRRRFNSRHLALANHYLFEPVACTPSAGWEKGQVENQVGNLREWLFTPTLSFANLEELNCWLAQRCLDLGLRKHPQLPITITEALQQEQPHLMPVCMPFDSYTEQALRVSSTCLVNIDRNRYSVPAQWAGKIVSVRVSANLIRIHAEGKEIAQHMRCFERERLICDPWHYVPLLETKPGALRHGAPFVDWQLPQAIESVRRSLLKQPKGDRAFAELLLIARDTGLEALDVTCQIALEQKTVQGAILLNELRRLTEPLRPPALTVADSLKLHEAPTANYQRYDSLLGGQHV